MRKDLIHQLSKIYQSPKANKFFARDELNFSDEVKKFFKRFESEWNKNFSIFKIQVVAFYMRIVLSPKDFQQGLVVLLC